jgi:hypothetical protein
VFHRTSVHRPRAAEFVLILPQNRRSTDASLRRRRLVSPAQPGSIRRAAGFRKAS